MEINLWIIFFNFIWCWNSLDIMYFNLTKQKVFAVRTTKKYKINNIIFL